MKFEETIENIIQKTAILYRNSDSYEAKRCYEQYVSILVLNSDREEQSRLEDMWEWEVE